MKEGRDEKPLKRIGRPRKYASDDKRPTLTFRARGGLYEQLKQSALAAERSLSEEIEYRLTQSFDTGLIAQVMGREQAPFVELVLDGLRDAVTQLQRPEDADLNRQRQLMAVLVGIVQAVSRQPIALFMDNVKYDDPWRSSAAHVVAPYLGVTSSEVLILIDDPADQNSLEQARNYKPPTLNSRPRP